jgi:hypothetical protein
MARDDAPAPTRGRGRPEIGTPVRIRIPADVLAQIDQIAADAEMKRAEVVRELLAEALKVRTRRRK